MGEISMLWDLIGEDTNEHGLPPGFRFHPTDEELVTFYLASKVYDGGASCCGVKIVDVDLNRCEPWELPEMAKMGEREWYFYSLKDRKYPTGLRTNRATGAGYWKATGKDREVYSSSNGGALVGMKKTLVFYRGRAPRGEKTKWVLHEYRLDGDLSNRRACNKEEWVICRIFHKAVFEKKSLFDFHNCNYYFQEPPSSLPFPFLPSLLERPQESAIQSFLWNNDAYHTYHLNNNNSNNNSNTTTNNNNIIVGFDLPTPIPAACPPDPFPPSNYFPSLPKPLHPNHCPVKETVPVPKQCVLQALDEEAVLGAWVDHSNPQKPFVFDVGHFNASASSLSCAAAVHDMSLPLQPSPPPALGAGSLPLLP